MNSRTTIAPVMGASAAETLSNDAHAEPVKLLRRIGSTTVEIIVHFSNAEKETIGDIILRLMEREVRNSA